METVWQDLRYSARTLAKNRGFTAVALVTLTLGIGANTAIFSVVNAVLLRPLPYRNADQLLMVCTHPPDQRHAQNPASLPDFKDWQAQNHIFSGMAAYAFNRFLIGGPEGTDETRGLFVTPDFFPLMGVPPILGRTLLPEDDHQFATVLSHRLWQRRYGGDASIIGKTIRLNDDAYTIVGVMPLSFRFPSPEIELWSSFGPIYATSGSSVTGDWVNSRALHGYRVVARLKQNVGQAQADAEMATIAVRLQKAYPDTNGGVFTSLVSLRTQLLGKVQTQMLILLGAVGFVLLIACINVADLVLARSVSREREVAVRRALGAGSCRLVRQVLTESLLLSGIGGVLGLAAAYWGEDLLVRLSPRDIPRLDEVSLDFRVLGFAFAASVVAAILFGLAPALRMRNADVNHSLRQGSAGAVGLTHSLRFRTLLVIGEVAIAMVLLAGAGLMIRSFNHLLGVNPGFSPNHLLSVRMFSPGHLPEKAELISYYSRVFERIRAIPGVVAAAGSTNLPPNMLQRAESFTVEGRPKPEPGREPVAIYIPVTPDYFRALGVPLLRGREFLDSDTASAPAVAVINQAIAQQQFANEDPLGKRITLSGVSRTVVGIVGDVKYEGLQADAGPEIYLPFAQAPFPGMYGVIRAAGDPLPLAPAVRYAMLSVDASRGPTHVRTMDEVLSESVATPRFQTMLLGLFGGVALLLAAVGVYGVMAYGVAQRTREIGIRMALGAEPRKVLGMVLREGLGVVAVGLGIGVVVALFATRALATLLFQVQPGDPATLAAVAAVLMGVALLACVIPARRATRVDTLVALRYE